jgi:hypothetical protein
MMRENNHSSYKCLIYQTYEVLVYSSLSLEQPRQHDIRILSLDVEISERCENALIACAHKTYIIAFHKMHMTERNWK